MTARRKRREPATADDQLRVIRPAFGWIISLRLTEDEAKELAEGRVPANVREDCRGMLDWVYTDPDKVWLEAEDE